MSIRVIPKLDIKSNNLVKGVNLEGLRVLGKPENFAELYYQQGADELIYQDVVASLFGRNALVDIISNTAKRVFIPLTVGGGIASIDDILMVLKAGADKVAINTAGLADPSFLQQAVQQFGSSTIVVAIEAMKQPDGSYMCFTDNGRNPSGKKVEDWVQQIQDLGVGEILLTSINQEGTGRGFDLHLYRLIHDNVMIPVIAHGGAGAVADVANLINSTRPSVNAVGIASLFHYDVIQSDADLGDIREGNRDYLQTQCSDEYFSSLSIRAMKEQLIQQGLACRCLQNWSNACA